MTALAEAPAVLPATCWCERTTVLIPVQWVSEARTGSCGPNCGPGCPAYQDSDYDVTDDAPAPSTNKRRTVKMKRFKPSQYNPASDSSLGYDRGNAVRNVHPQAVILEVGQAEAGAPALCPCGCGESPRSKATFGMGHDARLRGKLSRAGSAGCPIVLTDTNQAVSEVTDAVEYASRFSTDKLDWAESIRASMARVKRPASSEDAEREVLARATGPQVGDTKLIKVGRWEKTGKILAVYEDGSGILYEYVDGSGAIRQAREDADGKVRAVAQAS